MAAQARTMLFPLAALCLPALANIPRTPLLIAEKPHQGGASFAPALHRGPVAANPLIAPGMCECVCDFDRRSRNTGKERDAETGLDYFGARYYGGAQGRFTSPDAPLVDQHAADPQSWNLYAYVRNNPLRNTDPSGRDCMGAAAGIASAQSCVDSAKDALVGTAKAIGNIPSAIANVPNSLTNLALSLFTDYQGPEFTPLFTASNPGQAEGMGALNQTLLVSPLAEAGATAAVEALSGAAKVEATVSTGGRLGSVTTRAQNAAVADSLESRGFTVTGGGGRLPEEYLPGPGGGRRGSTFVDTTATRNGKTVRVQTVDTRADGVTPTTREANAAARIRAQQRPGDHTVLIPK